MGEADTRFTQISAESESSLCLCGEIRFMMII
jgi:hypothetical protein